MTDQQAIDRYKYLLQTAPPEAIEQVHEEAFAKLTPQQRRALLEQLAAVTPRAELSALKDDPHSLARAATRAEVREPGFLERLFSFSRPSFQSGPGLAGMFGSSFVGGLVGTVVGNAIAHHFLDHNDDERELFQSHAYDSHDALQGPDENAHYEDSDDYAEPNVDEGFDSGGFDDGGDIV